MQVSNNNNVSFGAIKILQCKKGSQALGVISEWSPSTSSRLAAALNAGEEVTFRLANPRAENRVARQLRKLGIPFFQWKNSNMSDKTFLRFSNIKFKDLLTEYRDGNMLRNHRVRVKSGDEARYSELPIQNEYVLSSAGFIDYCGEARRVLNIRDKSGRIHDGLYSGCFELLPDK